MLNVNGIPTEWNEKMGGLVDLIARHDIVCLMETRTQDFECLLEHVSTQYDRHFAVLHASEGRVSGYRGHGVVVLVDATIKRFVRVWKRSEEIQAIWLQAQGHLFGVDGDVCLGVTYINP